MAEIWTDKFIDDDVALMIVNGFHDARVRLLPNVWIPSTTQIIFGNDLPIRKAAQLSEWSTEVRASLERLKRKVVSNVSPAMGSSRMTLSARSVVWQSAFSERGLTVRSSCGSSLCLMSDLGYLQPWKPSQTKQLRSTSLDAFDNIESTERFIAYVDEYDEMSIKPVTISEMWEWIMEETWWYGWEERPELGGLFDPLVAQFKQAVSDQDCTVFRVSLDVEYSLKQPPGVQALQWGHHLGTTEDGYIFKAKPSKPRRGKDARLSFVTGFVRTITMEPLG